MSGGDERDGQAVPGGWEAGATQPLGFVRSEAARPDEEDSPVFRAVARRAASALPALGHADVFPAPRAVREGRRAAEALLSNTSGGAAADRATSAGEPSAVGAQGAAAGHSELPIGHATSTTYGTAQASTAQASVDGPVAIAPGADDGNAAWSVPGPRKSPESAEFREPDSSSTRLPDLWAEPISEDEYAVVGEVAATNPAADRSPGAAQLGNPGLTPVVGVDMEPYRSAEVELYGLSAVALAGNSAEAGSATDLVRPGPYVLRADSWDRPPDQNLTNQDYLGRRRAPKHRLWLIAAVVLLLGVGTGVALNLSAAGSLGLSPQPHYTGIEEPIAPGQVGTTPRPGRSNQPGGSGAPTPIISVSGSVTFTLSASPTVDPGLSPSVVGPPGTSTAPGIGTSGPPPVSVFTPLTLEAETSGVLSGTAAAVPYTNASGGSLVWGLGNWNGQPLGVLTFPGISIPTAGEYNVLIYYTHPSGEVLRDATISVPGVADKLTHFEAGQNCCKILDVSFRLSPGNFSIVITNSSGHAPAIDKIVIKAG